MEMKSWAVKRDDDTYLLAKSGTVRLFKTRAEVAGAAKRAKGGAKVQRVTIVDA